MGLSLDAETIAKLRENSRKAKPYREDEEYDSYFDYTSDREYATMAMETLKRHSLWTDEDERIAFGDK